MNIYKFPQSRRIRELKDSKDQKSARTAIARGIVDQAIKVFHAALLDKGSYAVLGECAALINEIEGLQRTFDRQQVVTSYSAQRRKCAARGDYDAS